MVSAFLNIFYFLVSFFFLLSQNYCERSGKIGRKYLLSGYFVSRLNMPRLVAVMFLIAFENLIA